MKQAAYGALALIVWSLVVFFVGRASVPDRGPEVKMWQDSAAVLIEVSRATDAARAADSVRLVAAEERATGAERRAARAVAVSAVRGAVADSLRGVLAEATTAADSVPVLVAVVAVQDTTIAGLRLALMDAAATLGELRGDLAAARAQRDADAREIGALRASLAAGIAATRPSRGRSKWLQHLALGVGIGVVGWELVR